MSDRYFRGAQACHGFDGRRYEPNWCPHAVRAKYQVPTWLRSAPMVARYRRDTLVVISASHDTLAPRFPTVAFHLLPLLSLQLSSDSLDFSGQCFRYACCIILRSLHCCISTRHLPARTGAPYTQLLRPGKKHRLPVHPTVSRTRRHPSQPP